MGKIVNIKFSLSVFSMFQGGGGDADASKQAAEKTSKAASPFEGEKKGDDKQDGVQSNGIMQNGLEDDKGFRQSKTRLYQDQTPLLPIKPSIKTYITYCQLS